jgi:hypothetical protein
MERTWCNVEWHCQTQDQTVEVERSRHFLRVPGKTFIHVVGNDRNQGRFGDVYDAHSERKHHVVQMVFQCGSENTKSRR